MSSVRSEMQAAEMARQNTDRSLDDVLAVYLADAMWMPEPQGMEIPYKSVSERVLYAAGRLIKNRPCCLSPFAKRLTPAKHTVTT